MTKPQKDYTIRTMTRAELDFAVDLAAKEGWNPGLHDADCFYAVDPQGFLIGELDGEPISCISVVRYPEQYSFLGFYIVKGGFRGEGYGYAIWQRGMAYLDGYNIGLDGVLEQVPKYEKSGFKLAHLNARYQGIASGNPAEDESVLNLTDVSLDEVVAYDQGVFLEDRRKFLQLWISRPDTLAIGIRDNEKLAGYAVVRPCREGYKIGPLFADSPDIARRLFDHINGSLSEGTPFFLDIPPADKNDAANQLVKAHNMEKVFETARMYRMVTGDDAPEIPLGKWFGITSFELG